MPSLWTDTAKIEAFESQARVVQVDDARPDTYATTCCLSAVDTGAWKSALASGPAGSGGVKHTKHGETTKAGVVNVRLGVERNKRIGRADGSYITAE